MKDHRKDFNLDDLYMLRQAYIYDCIDHSVEPEFELMQKLDYQVNYLSTCPGDRCSKCGGPSHNETN